MQKTDESAAVLGQTRCTDNFLVDEEEGEKEFLEVAFLFVVVKREKRGARELYTI